MSTLTRFEHTVIAQPADIDELAHVSNQVYLRWVLEIAVAHSTVLGWDHDRYFRLGAGWMVRRHELDYLGQVREGDAVRVATWVEAWKGVSCVRRTSMHRAFRPEGSSTNPPPSGQAPTGPPPDTRDSRPRDGAEVLRAATTWAFIDFARGRPRKIPDEIRALFADDVAAPAGV